MSILSNDLIEEIFSWIPVRDLLPLRFVCKSWFNLISHPNPSFGKLQLDRCNAVHIDQDPIILFSAKNRTKTYSLNYADDYVPSSSFLDTVEMVYPFSSSKPNLNVLILGSCNGLICIDVLASDDDDDDCDIMCLWNPTTKEFKRIPDTPFDNPHISRVLFGFGYDRIVDDYKIVRWAQFKSCEDDVEHSLNSEVMVYTQGTNLWRRVQEFPYTVVYREEERGLYVNGALHWIIHVSSERFYRIISFDVAGEEYGVVPKPDCFDGMVNVKLQVLRECLCIFNHGKLYKDHLEVWMMTDYGVKESWVHLFTATQSEFVDCWYLKPLWLCKNGEVLMEKNRKDLVLYDPKCDVAKFVGYRGIYYHLSDTEVYTGSLVSLESGTYTYQQQAQGRRKGKRKRNTSKRQQNRTCLSAPRHLNIRSCLSKPPDGYGYGLESE